MNTTGDLSSQRPPACTAPLSPLDTVRDYHLASCSLKVNYIILLFLSYVLHAVLCCSSYINFFHVYLMTLLVFCNISQHLSYYQLKGNCFCEVMDEYGWMEDDELRGRKDFLWICCGFWGQQSPQGVLALWERREVEKSKQTGVPDKKIVWVHSIYTSCSSIGVIPIQARQKDYKFWEMNRRKKQRSIPCWHNHLTDTDLVVLI